MKKVGMVLAGGIAFIVFFANIAPLITLAVTLGLAYLVLREFLRTRSTGAKVVWSIIGIVLVVMSIGNIPSLFGIAAAFVLYWIFRNWNGKKEEKEQDPFESFEAEWKELSGR